MNAERGKKKDEDEEEGGGIFTKGMVESPEVVSIIAVV